MALLTALERSVSPSPIGVPDLHLFPEWAAPLSHSPHPPIVYPGITRRIPRIRLCFLGSVQDKSGMMKEFWVFLGGLFF